MRRPPEFTVTQPTDGGIVPVVSCAPGLDRERFFDVLTRAKALLLQGKP